MAIVRTATSSGPARASLAGLVFVMLALAAAGAVADVASQLEAGFRNPPDTAKPHTWWHWMNGNISTEGIAADLQEMRRVGLGGAQIFDVAHGILPGPVKYMSEQWRAMVKYAVQEADRLGLELCIHNCAGWSSSGGPWIKPEHAMQMVTVSETRVRGPSKFDADLPRPSTRLDYYRDIAVVAFPTPKAELVTMEDMPPKITASAAGFEVEKVVDGNADTAAPLFLKPTDEPQYVAFEFPEPFRARSLTVLSAGGRSDAHRCQLQASDDGADFRTIADFVIQRPGVTRAPTTVTFPSTVARFFRLLFPTRRARSDSIFIAEVRLEPGFRIREWPGKAGYTRLNDPEPDRQEVASDEIIPRTEIRDISQHMNPDGHLVWDVPEGNWTILRIGHTPTGKDNHPAPEEGRGLECDKLSQEAVEAHWAGMLDKIIADIGPLAGKTLKHVLIDSYEVDCQNWTPRFREEFQARRGYDLLPYLPVMATGRVVESLDVSERFLWDVRRTIADLFADNYYGHFATLCRRQGMQLSVEPYGNGNFDDLTVGGRADIPMGEFWVGSGPENSSCKLAASVAHIYGKKYVGAESFTANPEQGRWQNHPWALKPLGDAMYCNGINRFIFHRYAHQPWRDLKPGMTMGPWGFHFERTITWWNQAPAWLEYLTRCQYLLQEGLFVADLCYFIGEGAPSSPPLRGDLRPPPPPGYDYDVCDAQALITRMSVNDGRIVMPDGMSYAVLVLPERQAMTPTVLRKVAELVRAGATVIGPKPSHSPSLQGYPQCDAEVRETADEVWGECDGKTVTRHQYGKGTVIWGEPLGEVLLERGIKPDFEVTSARGQANIKYIHRCADGVHIYFVCSQNRRAEVVDCTFRVSGLSPELWHPDTGKIEKAPIYRQQDGRTVVPMRLDPAGSVFVVFRQPDKDADHLVSAERNGASILLDEPRPAPKLEILKATYGVLTQEQPEMVDVTAKLAEMVRDGVLTVRADNSIAGDPAPNIVKQLRVDYVADGKEATITVNEGQMLRIPTEGRADVLQLRRAVYGVLPTELPLARDDQTVDVTDKLRALVQNGRLSVIADNSIAGDPAPFIVKQLRVDYVLDGQAYTRVVSEHAALEIPDGTEAGAIGASMPTAELSVSGDGQLVLTAWALGEYELTTAGGRKLRCQVRDVGQAVEIQGPWEVRFPAAWGAPEKATFEKLISWTESTDAGIKYFSGTGTYVKQITVPPQLIAPGKVLLLDLGVVRELAEVSVNGKYLGVLWKPPFRMDITRVAKPGINSLEIRVTNLWPNRLIGDEQLPDDCEWSGAMMKAWPRWLMEGQPRPPTGRLTFTTWKHYTKDSPLLPSGLIGPVTLRLGERVVVEKK